MLIAAESYRWTDKHVMIIKLVCWWRKHSALLFDLMGVNEHDSVLIVSKIN
jgi:hypothetical protein